MREVVTGLLDKAREAAEHASNQARITTIQAGDQFRVATGQAKVVAGQLGKATTEAVGTAATAAADPANHAKAKVVARSGLTKAKSGLSGAIDRIDPGLMADLVIKSTTLQERANRSLREKGSPYRINQITITAGIPPDVAFTIGRIEVEQEAEGALQPSDVADEPLDQAVDDDGAAGDDDDDEPPATGVARALAAAGVIEAEGDPLAAPIGSRVGI